MELKEDDAVLCTVKKIEGTTVFVSIEEDGEGRKSFRYQDSQTQGY